MTLGAASRSREQDHLGLPIALDRSFVPMPLSHSKALRSCISQTRACVVPSKPRRLLRDVNLRCSEKTSHLLDCWACVGTRLSDAPLDEPAISIWLSSLVTHFASTLAMETSTAGLAMGNINKNAC